MKRREFLTLLGGAAAAWPLAAGAQQATKLPTIGLLGATTLLVEGQRVAAFVQRLRELGWIEGRNVSPIKYLRGPWRLVTARDQMVERQCARPPREQQQETRGPHSMSRPSARIDENLDDRGHQ